MRVGYVASKTSNKTYALQPDQIIEACFTGPNPEEDARSYAKDYVQDTDGNAYVYRVSVESVIGFKISKEVLAFGTTE